jgi:hypothetical protein
MEMRNLTLGLPWLVAILPSLGLLLRRPLASAVAAIIAVISSASSLMFLIHAHGTGWPGAQLERGQPLASPRQPFDLCLTLVRWSPFVSLLAFMLTVDVSEPARIIAPYYCLLMPLLLTGRCHEALVRRNWWRGAAALTPLIAPGLLIINPMRPLWPARTILNPLSKKHSESSVITRAAMLYDAMPSGGMRQRRYETSCLATRKILVLSNFCKLQAWRLPSGGLWAAPNLLA